MKEKISLFCDVDKEAVIEARGHRDHLRDPAHLRGRRACRPGRQAPGAARRPPRPGRVAELVERRQAARRTKSSIAVVGKYTENGDAYISIAEALKHGGIPNDGRVNIDGSKRRTRRAGARSARSAARTA